jgi:RNA polymerase sigma factor (sigma-70 family)
MDPDPGAERDLCARLRRGEAAAFDEAYALHRARIWSFLARLAGDRALAEDLFQETWLSLARHATRLAEDTRLCAWLYTVARNHYRSHRRWALLDAARLRELGLGRPDQPPPSPEILTEAGEAERRIEHALARLPVRYREVLLLVAVEGVEPAQAAEILGLRPDALRQRIARARSMLRKALERSVPPPTPAAAQGG